MSREPLKVVYHYEIPVCNETFRFVVTYYPCTGNEDIEIFNGAGKPITKLNPIYDIALCEFYSDS